MGDILYYISIALPLKKTHAFTYIYIYRMSIFECVRVLGWGTQKKSSAIGYHVDLIGLRRSKMGGFTEKLHGVK